MNFVEQFKELAKVRAGISGVTATNAAKLLGLTNATVIKYLKQKKLVSKKIGISWHITLTELASFMKKGV